MTAANEHGDAPFRFSLDASGQKFDTKEDAQTIVDSLRARKDWQEVRLSGNTFGTEACQAVAEALRDQPALETLLFSDMFTGRLRSEIPHALTAFTEALLHGDKPNLREVDFSDNAFGPDCVRPLAPLLSQKTSLATVRLNNTGLGPLGGQMLADALLKAHEKNKQENKESQLRVIVAGRSRLENGSMPNMAKALQSHGKLTEVVFPQDGIRPEGIVILLRALAQCRDLQVLDLQDNTFSTKGARALANALPSWPRLRVLNVGDCLLKGRGALAVIAALEKSHHPELEVLNLQYNEMTEEGALALAKILKKYPKLRKLEVNGNVFPEDSDGAEALRAAVADMEKGDDVLGTMSDMEELDSDEEDAEDSDGADEEEIQLTADDKESLEEAADELAAMLQQSAKIADDKNGK